MPKAFWIVHVDVTDPDRYPDYVKADNPVIAAWGGRFLVRGGAFEAPEGTARSRHVVIEFDSMEQALGCYRSPEYQAAARIRQESADSEVIIAEGVA